MAGTVSIDTAIALRANLSPSRSPVQDTMFTPTMLGEDGLEGIHISGTPVLSPGALSPSMVSSRLQCHLLSCD